MNFFNLFLPILTGLLLLALYLAMPNPLRCTLPGELPPPTKHGRGHEPMSRDRSRALSRRDILPLLLVTLLYAFAAFFRLGSTAAPQSFVPMEGQEATIELPEGVYPSRILLYPGAGMGSYALEFSEDGEAWEHAAAFSQDHIAVLKWAELSPSSALRPRWLRLRCTSGSPWLGELVVLDGDGQPVPLKCSIPALCDEADTAPAVFSFQNSSYFDEIYHARTAWEHLNGVWPYEITHPPLGKEIMGLGILLFGMTPFGWRFSGTLFGVLMLPLLYVFLKKLFGGRWIPTLGMLLWASDFMHYVQTRIATIDTYSVFFILLMYLFMYLWLTEDRLWALALCGIAFGLGAAAKWTSIYAGAGLALLWAAKWIWRFVEARRGAKPSPRTGKVAPQGPDEVPAKRILSPDRTVPDLLPAFLLNVLFCLVFFIAVPVLIYYFSYLPYGRAAGYSPFSKDYAAMVWHNQVYMFTYHSNSVLGATHPYSSNWYQWLIDHRPILYVLEYPSAETKISVAAFLNPVLCWGGLLSLPLLGFMALARRDRRAAFLLVGYLSELLPWVLVPRLTFAYHYFPSSLFLVLSLGYVFSLLRENRRDWLGWVCVPVGWSVALFALFFPVLNGLPIGRELSTALYQWLPTWPL